MSTTVIEIPIPQRTTTTQSGGSLFDVLGSQIGKLIDLGGTVGTAFLSAELSKQLGRSGAVQDDRDQDNPRTVKGAIFANSGAIIGIAAIAAAAVIAAVVLLRR